VGWMARRRTWAGENVIVFVMPESAGGSLVDFKIPDEIARFVIPPEKMTPSNHSDHQIEFVSL
jgi:hypothetical protein